MVALDLALGHRMVGGRTSVLHPFLLDERSRFARDITGAIVGEQARTVFHEHVFSTVDVRDQELLETIHETRTRSKYLAEEIRRESRFWLAQHPSNEYWQRR